MPVQHAPDPLVLYRIGRSPSPLHFPPRSSQGRGRYDDPSGRVAVLYAAASRRGAFMETLDQYRYDIATMAEARTRTGGVIEEAPHRSFGRIPRSFFQRQIAAFRVAPGQQWLDVRSPETHATVLRAMATAFLDLDVGTRFTLGQLLSGDYRISRIFTQWALDQGFHGIAYASCHDLNTACWAIFEGATIVPIDSPQPINPLDPDLRQVATLWQMATPADP